MKEQYFTSESVTMGHPDKVCDAIVEGILDAIIYKDKNARVACECICTTGMVMIFGEITTSCYVDMPKIARKTIKEIGYIDAKYGFTHNSCAVMINIDEQSEDIADSLFKEKGPFLSELNAGDQGMVFGFACDETQDFMPLPITLAHELAKRLDFVRKKNIIPYLRPDGKTQVSVKYTDGTPSSVTNVIVSCQHDENIDISQLRRDIIDKVILNSIPQKYIDASSNFIVNPSGRFIVGGPVADSGLTGRKIIVDSYGGYSRHGGGAFCGKDPTKVDRSGAYFARYVAKNVVAAALACKCEIGISYAIGLKQPLAIFVDTFGTGIMDDFELKNILTKVFDFTPGGIIKKLDLLRPIYKNLACYGHFGRQDLDLSWEKLDMVDELKRICSRN